MVTQRLDDGKWEIVFMDNSISSKTFQAMLYYIYSGEYDKLLRDSDLQSFIATLQRFSFINWTLGFSFNSFFNVIRVC